MQWMRDGACLVEGCRYRHEVPQKAEEHIQVKAATVRTLDVVVTPAVWKHLNEVSSEQFITDNNLVLLDSGSNEVARPYNGWEWQHILDNNHTPRESG